MMCCSGTDDDGTCSTCTSDNCGSGCYPEFSFGEVIWPAELWLGCRQMRYGEWHGRSRQYCLSKWCAMFGWQGVPSQATSPTNMLTAGSHRGTALRAALTSAADMHRCSLQGHKRRCHTMTARSLTLNKPLPCHVQSTTSTSSRAAGTGECLAALHHERPHIWGRTTVLYSSCR